MRALRRNPGQRYGTVLVDLERNRVVDLLPDRRAESLSVWLRANPGVEIVVRNRASVYADGARQGAPDAVQVTDRWHLLRNLGDAIHAVTDRHHAAIQRIGREVMAQLVAEEARSTPVVARGNVHGGVGKSGLGRSVGLGWPSDLA
ncbi:transposase, partial [Belnapia sp. T18]|nr:transposase [Belnapia arida]